MSSRRAPRSWCARPRKTVMSADGRTWRKVEVGDQPWTPGRARSLSVRGGRRPRTRRSHDDATGAETEADDAERRRAHRDACNTSRKKWDNRDACNADLRREIERGLASLGRPSPPSRRETDGGAEIAREAAARLARCRDHDVHQRGGRHSVSRSSLGSAMRAKDVLQQSAGPSGK